MGSGWCASKGCNEGWWTDAETGHVTPCAACEVAGRKRIVPAPPCMCCGCRAERAEAQVARLTEENERLREVLRHAKEWLDEDGCDCGTDEPGSCALCETCAVLDPVRGDDHGSRLRGRGGDVALSRLDPVPATEEPEMCPACFASDECAGCEPHNLHDCPDCHRTEHGEGKE